MKATRQGTGAEASSGPGTALERAPRPPINPDSGEVLPPLGDAPDDVLAEAALALRAYEAEVRDWRRRVEAELTGRMIDAQRRQATFGSVEVKFKPARKREWDGDELEVVLRDLYDRGVIALHDVPPELIRHEVRVDGRKALDLLGRLHGPALSAVEACFEWRANGTTLEVARSIALLPNTDGEQEGPQ